MSNQVKPVVLGADVPHIPLNGKMELRLSVYRNTKKNLKVGFYFFAGKGQDLKDKEMWLSSDKALKFAPMVAGKTPDQGESLIQGYILRGTQIGEAGFDVRKSKDNGWKTAIMECRNPAPKTAPVAASKPTPVANPTAAADAFAVLDGFEL